MKKIKLKKKFKVFLTIYLMLFTLTFILTTFSKYLHQVTGTGTKAIAKWEVLFQGDNTNTINIVKANTTQEYKLKVTNNSEVGIVYSVVLSNVPNGVTVELDGIPYTPLNGEIKLENVGTINANASQKTKEHALNFSASLSAANVNNSEIDMDVTFTQVNP